jgi:hypothetical protein
MVGPTDRALGALVVAVFFFVSWALARRWPLGATLMVTSVYAILEIAGVVRYGPLSLLSGIVVKVLLVSALVRGVAAGLEIRSLRGAAQPGDRRLLTGLLVLVATLGILVGVTMGRADQAKQSRSVSGMED